MNRQRHATPNLVGVRGGRAVVEYYFQSSKPLLCKLFEHCALAQRSAASKQCFERRRASKIKNFIIFIIFMIFGSLMADSTYREKWYPEYFNLNEALHVPRLNISSDWNSRLLENEFRDFQKSEKIVVKIIVKSGRCPPRFCRGGVLLTEFETSPLQVIWTLRLGASLWSSRTVFWEPEPAENHDF